MCLDKVHEKQELGKGNAPAILALERGGSILLDIPHRRRIPQQKMLVNGEVKIRRHVPSTYRHANGVNQVEVDTILFCEENGYELEFWEHEKHASFTYNNEEILVIPDVFYRLKINNKSIDFFLEFDCATEDRLSRRKLPVIYNKIMNYKKYKYSNLWTNHSISFPIILLVTHDSRRIPYFNVKCKENGIQGFGVFHENYTGFMKKIATLVK